MRLKLERLHYATNRPISPSVPQMYDAAVTLVHKRQVPVHEKADAISRAARSGVVARAQRLVATVHASSRGATKLAGDIGLVS